MQVSLFLGVTAVHITKWYLKVLTLVNTFNASHSHPQNIVMALCAVLAQQFRTIISIKMGVTMCYRGGNIVNIDYE